MLIGTTALTGLLGEWRVGGHAHADLAAKLEVLLLDGRIASGTRLPAEREMAKALGVSRTTIVSAYRVLREKSILRSVQGSGSVLELPSAPRRRDSAPLDLDLSKAVPRAWHELPDLSARALQRLPHHLSHAGIDFFGLPDLRAAIARRYTERGAPTSPENILVTLGAQHAIALVARTLLGRGDRVVVESPSYPHALDAFLAAGARLIASPLDSRAEASLENGASTYDTDQLVDTLRGARPTLAYLMPDFQNPTGASLDDDERLRILRAAAQTGTPLLIDETTADLDIDRPFVATPFAAVSHHGATVITVGSLSKTVWSGLRIGWIRADRHLIERLALARPAGDMGNAVIEQLVAQEAIGDLPRILESRRDELRHGRDHATALLRSLVPEWHVPAIDGGLALWVHLGAPLSSALVQAGRARGVTVTAGSRFGIDGAFERRVRIPITADEATLTEGLTRLADAWTAVRSGGHAGRSLSDPAFVA